jgi:hypothetical protein
MDGSGKARADESFVIVRRREAILSSESKFCGDGRRTQMGFEAAQAHGQLLIDTWLHRGGRELALLSLIS